MNPYDLAQGLVVGTVVALSAWTVIRPWFRKPSAAADGTGNGCSTGSSTSACSRCGGCAKAISTEQPIRFHR